MLLLTIFNKPKTPFMTAYQHIIHAAIEVCLIHESGQA
jgi:hypothetical protein